MIVAHLESFDGTNGRYRLIDARIIAENVSEADATRITRLLNQEAESKTPTPPSQERIADVKRRSDNPTPGWRQVNAPDLEKQAAINRPMDKLTIEAEQLVPGCGCSVCEAIRQRLKDWS